ncbi:hypothetical protein [Paraburkholderia sp. MM5384-R2]|uniref:hypothetical protein n=1 Tax=Paraburkholderia sp. MM5384-R2 TaxID=2723097 RepID=UPI0017C817DC|nr:hypothetical protein [Paraburkholderia sp. MM5384-R2]MBB5498614.1 hypothetical protein [Paraburkholderia sp. MM5384-R2]
MSVKRNRSRASQPRRPLTKALLLPMDRASASEQSLRLHLALVACRECQANSHLINELMRAVYLAYFLQRAGYGRHPAEHFKVAECAVEVTLVHAHETGEWRLMPDVIGDFEELIALYDAQLARAPLHAVRHAEEQLRDFLAGTESSPIVVEE